MMTEYLFLEEASTYRNNFKGVMEIIRKDKVLHDSFLNDDNFLPWVERIGITLRSKKQDNDDGGHYHILKNRPEFVAIPKPKDEDKASRILFKLGIGY
jgi:hypothetical protein